MQTLLLRGLLLLLFVLGLGAAPAAASHLVGGEMSYKYLDANGAPGTPFRYRITVLLYINWECNTASTDASNVPDGRCNIFVNIYNKQNGARLNSGQVAQNFTCNQVTCTGRPSQAEVQPQGSYRLPRVSNPSITPPLPGGCTLPGGPPPPVRLCRYETIVELPVSFDGYYVVYTDGTRNRSINNLQQPDNQNQTIYMDMAPPLLPNSSPTFSDTAVVVICQGDTSIVVNNAVDLDGDRLIYSFSTPYNISNNVSITTFTPPPPSVTYIAGYSATAPFGNGVGNYAFLNASTGLSRYATTQQGRFVVAVEVKEFRRINGNEVLIGSTRREIQLVSRTCQPNRSPQFTAATLANKVFTIEEGEALNFNLAATDPDGNAVSLKVNSVLLDGPGAYDASFGGSQGVVQLGNPTGSVTITGAGGSVSGQFSFNSRCGNGRSTLYDVVVTATDQACGAKSVAEVFQIRVNRAAGPTGIDGDNIICDQSQASTYSATGPTPASYQWKVRGGLIQGSNAGRSVQVRWNATGTGHLTLQGISALGCPSDSVTRDVDIRPGSGLAVTPTSAAICRGASTTLTASGGVSYTWTGGSQPITGPTLTVAPTQTTTYTVTSTDGICTTSRQVTVTVNPAAVANAGADVTACSGESTTLGTAALTGYTYQWSPATGLSSTSAAQPTFLLTNTGTTAQQFTYTLTATTAEGCTATDVIVVTLNPAAVADAGTSKAFCSGGSAQLGNPASAVAGSTYQWSPATGLSSTTVLAPTVTLTNTTSAPITTTYTLRVTTDKGCTDAKTVAVTVNPAAVANAGADVAACSGESTTLGTAALTGYTYQWSPATGLSSTSAAQPTFLLTNTGTAAQQFTYTLTATTAEGCTATDVVVVTLNPAAVANAGPDAALCDGRKVTLGTAALTGYTYQWSPATGLSSATATRPELTAVNTTQSPVTRTYTVTATTAEGCSQTDQVVVTITPRPRVDNIQGAASVCPTIQGVVYSILNPRSTEYRWTVVGGTITGGDGTASITVNWGGANANASVQAVARNQFQCDADPTSFPVAINQRLDTETPKGPTSVCLANGPNTYSVAPTTGSIYAWQITGGTQVGTGPGTVQVQWNGPGTGTILVTETSTPQGGAVTCFGQSKPLAVTILPSPAANLTLAGPDRVCAGGTVSFSLPGAVSSSYAFTLEGAPVASSGNTVTLATPTAGTYKLTAQETNASACAGPVFTKQFTVDPRPAAVTIAGPASICPGPNGAGFAPQQYAVLNTAGSTYAWTVTGGTIASGNGTNAITVNFTAGAEDRTVAVTESSRFGCAGPVAALTVRPDNVGVGLRTASVTTDDRSISIGFVVVNPTSNTNQVRVLRREAGTTAAFATVGSVANSAGSYTDTTVDPDARAYDYRLELLNNCGTTLASQEHTTIRTQALATEGSQDGRREGSVKVSWNAYKGFEVKEYQLFRAADNGSTQLLTTLPGTTLDREFPSSSAGFDQCFRVVAVSAQNPAITASSNDACVNFTNDLVFYNIITPNNDHINDAFTIRNIDLYSGYSMSFFNRWGKEVYQTSRYNNDWQAESQPAGVYYYLLKLSNGKSYKGWFEVVK
ncbi:T9SS type B sorting domain-containing protein [Hymenobacter chitinivorans]|uniref:Gliding motility-associated-like protein n=1 Tax=Hymenobacter chitinivorans DSM 11115 TaxID=1121954 RepID=A0A2M9BSX9_9BACT|nr:gliding motility-associated C-terminal domain-containing protein [Hymenobacter chitinivorans]PJJ61055.1 gliding motility-associated-like protein [Hymenobacter chitinivorans DSM 11115]